LRRWAGPIGKPKLIPNQNDRKSDIENRISEIKKRPSDLSLTIGFWDGLSAKRRMGGFFIFRRKTPVFSGNGRFWDLAVGLGGLWFWVLCKFRLPKKNFNFFFKKPPNKLFLMQITGTFALLMSVRLPRAI